MSSPCPFCLFSFHIPHSQFYFSFLSCAPRSLMPALSLSVSHQYLQRRQQENVQRQSRGEPPLPEEDITKMFKPPQPPPRMDTLLIAGTHTHIQTHHLHTYSTRHLHHIDPLLLQTPSAASAPLTGAQVLFCNYLRHYLEITIIWSFLTPTQTALFVAVSSCSALLLLLKHSDPYVYSVLH